MDRITQTHSVSEWLDVTREHKCAVKKMTPKDDSVNLVMGHACACGVVFTLNGDDYKNTVNDLKPAFKVDMIKDSMKSKAGREALAGVLSK